MSPGPLYTNPVYPESFPDPYVLKVRGEYWAYCTGTSPDGRRFGVLRSRDLVHWTPQAGALAPLPGDHPCYWAPEVVEHEGRFYLYYSVGNEETMQLRVAVANHPGGPFTDSGHRLTSEPFAIDAHVFTDPASGARYLFYAVDFLEHRQIGTGTVVDRLLDPFTLEGRPRPVALPRFDWHVYHPNRPAKGGVRWHTVEGPFVLSRKGLYYEMFSGGNWQNPTYGVSYATTASLDRPDEWLQAADGERVLPILRTTGEVVGPGHNSVVRGPDNRQLWCVYHRWSAGARVLAIDPLDWAGDRLLVLGPTTTPRPAPIPPTFYIDTPEATLFEAGATSFLLEVSVRGPASGLALHDDHGPVFRLHLEDEARVVWRGGSTHSRLQGAVVPPPLGGRKVGSGGGQEGGSSWRSLEGEETLRAGEETEEPRRLSPPHSSPPPDLPHSLPRPLPGGEAPPPPWLEERFALPTDFSPHVFHLLRLDLDGLRLTLTLDGLTLPWTGRLAAPASRLSLLAEAPAAEFAGLTVTVGWEELFLLEGDPAHFGWQPLHSAYEGKVIKGRLQLGPGPCLLTRGPALSSYLLVVNARLDEPSERGWILQPAFVTPADPGPSLTLEQLAEAWALRARDAAGERLFALPASFDPFQDQQFRCRREGIRIDIEWEGLPLGDLQAPPAPSRVGIGSAGGAVAFEMVRVTALPEREKEAGDEAGGEESRCGNCQVV